MKAISRTSAPGTRTDDSVILEALNPQRRFTRLSAAAHTLYQALGFARMGTLVDFYADGDGKALFGRKL